ncbi:MAG TPA: stage II sporulation protein M [Steroidobacteraceae bacterium]|nr:stage II sporulation protein M [Steroidobacteraceae bacterium]
MTPLQFERRYAPVWDAFEQQLGSLANSAAGWRKRRSAAGSALGPAFAAGYRQCCEHLALARSRDYPLYLVERLERLTATGHQLIYRQRTWGIGRLLELARRDFPRAVRAHRRYVWLAAALLMVPTIFLAVVVARKPELVTTVIDAGTASQFEQMYSDSTEALGRVRTADTDWQMFGYYIRNNMGIAFQCFAGGIFLGLGSIGFLLYNGFFGGAVAGYLVSRGLAGNFFPFVATHSAFELTAIVLAGAAGLRIGHALVAPGRSSRTQALATAGREATVIVYGVVVMLLIAAGLEAFWSSSVWLPSSAKYLAASLSWGAVLSYFWRQGRHAD